MKISKYALERLIFLIIIAVGFFLFVSHPTKESFLSKHYWQMFIIFVPFLIFLAIFFPRYSFTTYLSVVIMGISFIIFLGLLTFFHLTIEVFLIPILICALIIGLLFRHFFLKIKW